LFQRVRLLPEAAALVVAEAVVAVEHEAAAGPVLKMEMAPVVHPH